MVSGEGGLRDAGRGRGAVGRLSRIGAWGRHQDGVLPRAESETHRSCLPAACSPRPSLPVQQILFLSEKKENFWSSHCAPTMCPLSRNAFTPRLLPQTGEATAANTPMRFMEDERGS